MIGLSLFRVEAGHLRKTHHVIRGGGSGHLVFVAVETEFNNLGNYGYVNKPQ